METPIARQQWAAQRIWNPATEATPAWNEAGTYQSAGAYGDGVSIVECSISQLEDQRDAVLIPRLARRIHAAFAAQGTE